MLSLSLYLLSGLVLLIVGGEALVRGASRLALSLGISPMVVGLTVVAFGTSAPELAVSLQAAFNGNADIAVTNVVGSNIFNILLILGLCGLISPLFVDSKIIKREVPFLIFISFLLYAFVWDHQLNRWEGLVLFSGIIIYTYWLVRESQIHRKENKELLKESQQEYKKEKSNLFIVISLIIVGLGVIIWGADLFVHGAIELAKALGVREEVIGLTIVAAGTSLPEVVASIMATIKGEREIAIGNVIGSNIYNILAILGLSGLISSNPLSISQNLLNLDFPIMIFAAILCFPFFKSGSTLSRKEGFFFFTIYVTYTAYLIANARA